MKKVTLCLLAFALLLGACKSKLEKKDQSLDEMQEEEPGNYDPVLSSASATPVYKKIGDSVEMHLNIYYPENHLTNLPSPVIIYFFGGAFIHGSPIQFEEHCKYFAGRGIVAIAADYRVISRNKGNALNCIYDAKSAIRYLREHARELNIDPDKIVMAGGSAGAFLAIECAINDTKWQDASDNAAVSPVPNALVLLNPVVNAMEHKFRIAKFLDDEKAPESESHASEIDPMTHIKPGMPTAIAFHGTADKISAYKFVKQFSDDYIAAGNKMDLHTYEGEKHGFTSMQNKGGKYFLESLKLTDEFMISLGYLSGSPSVETIKIPEMKPQTNKKTPNLKNKKIKKAEEAAPKPQ
ncbi:MAG: alpha/beta hydrolase [Chitinophagales bacterium]|jgi:acetyl esterase/lipase|nr:alpha/beta hydrolase [Bacteroidota bacterium]MBK7568176.1 alpha/beta hydrolase [Bacteroidota bacterium]MBP8916745.1 alpha/beta hydrolase [Chitinophagales bacterium]MBP9220369.1 alpha/beta hydrolase [Chitinophagales bacterium]MBP9797183.1 alpha/beta hydrolase [Chitinophagales bacterium]